MQKILLDFLNICFCLCFISYKNIKFATLLAHFSPPVVLAPPQSGACASLSPDQQETSSLLLDDAFSRPLPDIFPLGDRVVADLAPNGSGRTSLTVPRSGHVQFNWTMGAVARLAVYGRLTLPPTPTQHDFVRLLLGPKLHATPDLRGLAPYAESQVRDIVFCTVCTVKMCLIYFLPFFHILSQA